MRERREKEGGRKDGEEGGRWIEKEGEGRNGVGLMGNEAGEEERTPYAPLFLE